MSTTERDDALAGNADDLTALPAQIDAAIQDVETHAIGMVQAAERAGRLLLRAKAGVPHGEWDDWLRTHCKVAPRTAQAYMRLCTKLGELPPEKRNAVAALPLREAMKAITRKAEATCQEPVEKTSNAAAMSASRDDALAKRRAPSAATAVAVRSMPTVEDARAALLRISHDLRILTNANASAFALLRPLTREQKADIGASLAVGGRFIRHIVTWATARDEGAARPADRVEISISAHAGAEGAPKPARSRKAACAPCDPALSPGQRARQVGHPRQLELPTVESLP